MPADLLAALASEKRPATLAQAMAAIQAPPLALERLDAQLLMLHVLGRKPQERAWLLAHDTDPLAPAQWQNLLAMCQRRSRGEPVAYLLGHKEFFGLQLTVNPAVLVPRPDTETLVEWALEYGDSLDEAQAATSPLRVMDLGTGSGAIALALKSVRPHWELAGLDASAPALEVAHANGEALGLEVQWLQGHWLAELALQPHNIPKHFDLIVSNPPYIAPQDTHLAALHAEPLSALVAPKNGLADLASIVAQAPAHLREGGALLLEHGYNQADAVRALLLQAGFSQVASRCDLAGVQRCTGGIWGARDS